MIKRILKWIFYIIITLIIGLGASLYVFKDRIIQQVITEVNNFLAVPIEVAKVEIDFFHGLPNVSVAFIDVALPVTDKPIITAGKIYAILNPIQILQGELNIAKIEIQDAKLLIYVDENNSNNLSELIKTNNQENLDPSDTTSAGFNLNAIQLKNVEVNYINKYSGAKSKAIINTLKGDLSLYQGVYYSKVITEINFIEYSTKAWNLNDVGVFNYNFNLSYDTDKKSLDLNESDFRFRGANAGVSGNLTFQDIPRVDLHINAADIEFKLLADFLPANYSKILNDYQTSGSVHFRADLLGDITRKSLPGLEAIVELNNVDLTEKKYNANIHDLNMNCKLSIKDLANLATATVSINSGKGILEDRPFNLAFNLRNLNNPVYDGTLTGSVSTSWLLGLIRFPYYKSGEGDFNIALKFNGDKKQEHILDNLHIHGEVDLESISFSINDSVNIDDLRGIIRFGDENISLTNVSLEWLESDVNINGNIFDNTSADGTSHQLVFRSDISSSRFKIENIVQLISGVSAHVPADSSGNSDLDLDLELIASFDNLKFQRFNGTRISGEILYQDNILEVVDLNGRAMGGVIRLNGKLKEMPNLDIVIQAEAQTKGVNIDSLFYVFKNFRQDFIREEHLSGRVYSDVKASMYFDKNWRFRSKLLATQAKIGIVNGELSNFEPIMALSDYLDDKDDNLAQLKFSNIVNNILIRQDTIFIPEMSIQTNVRNMALGGYHTLDQHINYQLAVPIINERVDKDEEFGAVQKSSSGSPNLLFRIKGTTSDYRVNYDLLRATGNVLKLLDITKIFKKKEEAEIDSSFLEDEEFDWNKEDR